MRARREALGRDDDYEIYLRPKKAREVMRRYGHLRQQVEKWAKQGHRLSRQEVGDVLTEMSSGSRLWYRAGALTAWRLERSAGRDALVRSVKRPSHYVKALKAEVARLST